jgi:hypothetical protein
MSQRTSLDQQITAVSSLSRRNNNQALKDALDTLCQLKKVNNALHREEPDIEQVTKLLEDLLLGS